MEAKHGKLPFDEAIEFFKQKVNLPTQKWTDIWQGMHARAFVVAGATRDDLLCDFRGAIDKAISEGTTLKEFQKDFDNIVKKHGWNYQGGRNWRSKVIYDTNMRTAYQAGRYKQIKEIQHKRPYLGYRHGDSINPRPVHLSWDGKILRVDDPFWSTHYPPNGWGCKCKAFTFSDRDLKRMGKSVDTAPDDGFYDWTDKTGKRHKIPNGIDPGWDYNVGESAWGKKLSEKAMEEFRASKDKWVTLTKGNYKTYNRPEKIPLDVTKAKPISRKTDAVAYLKSVMGDKKEKIFSFQDKNFRYDVNVNAETLGKHITQDKIKHLARLEESLIDPYEVWLSFEKNKATGKVVLRQRIIKGFATDTKTKGYLIVTNATKGQMEAWTASPGNNISYINNQRRGKLIWKRD